MATISLRLPRSLHERVRELARREGVSINQFIVVALAEKTAVLFAEDYLAERAARGDRARFEAAMAKVAEADPPAYDTLDNEANGI